MVRVVEPLITKVLHIERIPYIRQKQTSPFATTVGFVGQVCRTR